MNNKIVDQINRIAKLELENINLNKQLDIVKNEEQIAVSKKNELLNTKTFLDSKLKENWELLKELVVKEN
jgi:hypothetical protein